MLFLTSNKARRIRCVINRTRGTVVGDRVRTARTFLSRLVGLLGTAAIADGEGLWIVPCRSVHTLGMRYPIDVAFLDAGGVVVGILGGLPPNRVGRVFRDARGALELRSGILAATGTVPGDRLEFEGADRLDTIGRRLLHCSLALSLPEC